MNKCNSCGFEEYDGALFCSECGSQLSDDAQNKTSILPFSEKLNIETPTNLSTNEIQLSSNPQTFIFVIPSSGRRTVVTAKEQIRVGRKDSSRGVEPELDLTPDNGAKYGVSRLHAMIQLTNNGPILIDLDSTNGTLLNNYRLPAASPYQINSGDEIRFGHLLVHCFYET